MERRQLFMAGISVLVMSVLFTLPVTGQLQQEKVDMSAMSKIRDEGLQRSKVMETASYLTDVFGPRLTNSPSIKAAAQWTVKKMTEWGMTNVKLESWGPFGRGWSNERTYVAMTKPYAFPLIAYPRAWTPGTNGTVKGDVVLAIFNTPEDLEDCPRKASRQVCDDGREPRLFLLSSMLPAAGIPSSNSRRWPIHLRDAGGQGGNQGGAARGNAAPAPTPAKLPGQLCGGMLPAPQAPRGQGGQQATAKFHECAQSLPH
jgi:hypothetical protein